MTESVNSLAVAAGSEGGVSEELVASARAGCCERAGIPASARAIRKIEMRIMAGGSVAAAAGRRKRSWDACWLRS